MSDTENQIPEDKKPTHPQPENSGGGGGPVEPPPKPEEA